MSNFEETLSIGSWYLKKSLGKGSFGEVSLWENKETGQEVAIKKFILFGKNTPPEVAEKAKQRWNKEIEYIENRIQNENIVRAIKVNPPEFIEKLNKTNISGLPFLIMEFCNGGDLRREISENCFGLQESDVLNVLKSLKSSISYLHEIGITHRDIKPENIVIQRQGDEKTYKLTDLGYAKDIGCSIEASHVGTVGYFAPELIMNKKYSCTVDYWSMGVVVFEVICGRRPFVPHLRFPQAFQLTLEKKSNHIAITQNIKQEFIYHDKLCEENYINCVLKRYLENWLKNALDLDGKQRGSTDVPESVPFEKKTSQPKKIFAQIEKILSLNILTVFCLSTYQFLSYEISDEMTMNELVKIIAKDINIEEQKIYIILPLEQTKVEELTQATKPIDLILKNDDIHTPMLYVADMRTEWNIKQIQPMISSIIEENMASERHDIKLFHVLEFCRHALYFIENEENLYLTFLKGLHNYGIYLNDLVIKFKDSIDELSVKIYQLVGAMNFQCNAYKFHKKTLESKNMTYLCEGNIEKWEQENNKIFSDIQTLRNVILNISKRYESVLRRSNEVKDHELFETKKENIMQCKKANPKVKIRHVYEKLKISKQNIPQCHKEICELVCKSLKQREHLLTNSHLKLIQSNLSTINGEFMQIKLVARNTLNQLLKYESRINLFYVERFNDICQIIENNTREKYEQKEKHQFSGLVNGVCDRSICSNNGNSEGSMINSMISYFNNEHDTKSLIEENEELRRLFNDLNFEIN